MARRNARPAEDAAALSAGTYAEHVSTKEAYLAHQPSALSFEEAGGVPLAALTAYQVRAILQTPTTSYAITAVPNSILLWSQQPDS